MQRCLTDFSSPVLHNLTALSVIDIVATGQLAWLTEDSSSVAPTVEGWLQILQNMPNLQYLTLVNSITRTNNLKTTKCSDIPLSSLRLFSLTASLDEGAVLLQFLKFPSSCGIRLRCKDRNSPSQVQVGSILAAISNQISPRPNPPDGKIGHLQVKLLDGGRIHFGNSVRIGLLWNIPEADELRQHAANTSDPLLSLVFLFNDFPTARRFIRQLLALYEPTFSTTTDLYLWIDEQSTVTHEDVAFLSTLAHFTAFNAVKTLDLYGQSLTHLLPLFDSLSQADKPVFPSLGFLRLTGTIFTDREDPVYQIVLQFLLRRVKLNVPLVRVAICSGEMSTELRLHLQENSQVEVVSQSSKLV
jgi:hypothetical protein